MAFTYSIATDAGQIRLGLGDTDSAAYTFEDDEIAYFLSSGGSVTGGIVQGLRTLFVSRSLRAKRFTLPGITYDDTGALASIQAALTLYGADIPTATVRMGAEMDMDSGFTDPTPTVY